jgi:hypothetical protein
MAWEEEKEETRKAKERAKRERNRKKNAKIFSGNSRIFKIIVMK